MPFWEWSKTAASNATADPTINWAEGMSPSSVNDSARAMMARAAEWRDDVSGTITTAGSGIAYTATTNQGFDTLAHLAGAMIAFVPHTTNGVTVTLSVDGLAAKPLRYGPGLELQSGMLIQGTPYVATYNNSGGAFYLRGFHANPYGIPLGGLLPYVGSSAPNTAFALPFGQAISRTTYATLFGLIGTTFGSGDGSTTFNIPDLRGRIPAGLDNMGGSAASRIGSVVTDNGTIVGTTIGSTGGSATHAQATSEVGQHSHGITEPNSGSGHKHGFSAEFRDDGTINTAGSQNGIDCAPPASGSARHTDFSTTGITINNSSAPSAMAWLQPTIILPYILRVI
jgi:microcystin-dependent protein